MKRRLDEIGALIEPDTAALIFTPVSRYYLTGFSSSLGYLFLTENRRVLLVDGRYFEAAAASVSKEIEVVLLRNLAEQGKELLAGKNRLLVETANTVAEVRRFESLFSIPVEPLDALDARLMSLRSVKNEYEIACMEQAQRMAEAAFDFILGFIRPGVSELLIAAELEYRMKLAGSEEASFQTICVSGSKTSMPHGVPGDRCVENGDFVTMDFGAVYGGYHSDMTRTVAVGSVSQEMRRVYDTVLAANEAAEEKVSAGVTCAAVDRAARGLIEQAGYGEFFSHSTGHGVGLEIHESPNVSFKNTAELICGQIITVEPGIYLPGKFGVRIEDMLAVTKNGYLNLTKSPKGLIII